MNMTDQEVDHAVIKVLEQYGQLINVAQGTQEDPKKTVGAITIAFHSDGQHTFAFAGVFQRATALGALLDCLLTLRESIQSQQVSENLNAFVEMLGLQPGDIN